MASTLPLLLLLQQMGMQIIPSPPELIKSDCQIQHDADSKSIWGCIDNTRNMIFLNSAVTQQDSTIAHEFAHAYGFKNKDWYTKAVKEFGDSETIADSFDQYYNNPSIFQYSNPQAYDWFKNNISLSNKSNNMATTVPTKYYVTNVNGKDYYQALPGYNTPSGYREVTYPEFIAGLKAFDVSNDSRYGGAKTMYDYWQQTNPSYIQPDQSSGYVIDPATGNMTTQSALDEASRLASDPNMVNIGTATAPRYVPKDSAGYQNFLSPTTQTTQQAAQVSAAGLPRESVATDTVQVIRDGNTVQIKNDPATIKMYTDAGYTLGGGTTTAASTAASTTTAQSTGWIDPATGDPTAVGVGIPVGTGSQVGVSTTPPDTGTGTTSTTGNAQLDGILSELQAYLKKLKESGQAVNPAVELSPEIVQQFLDQAKTELNPYYSSQITSIQGEISASLQSMQKQWQLDKDQAQADFKKQLSTSQEDFAGAGSAFSGGRGASEQQFIEGTNRKLALSAQQAADAAGNILSGGEQKLGTRNVQSLFGYGQFTPGQSSTSGFYDNGNTLSYQSPGNTIGSLEREQTTATELRRASLEAAERAKRALNFYA